MDPIKAKIGAVLGYEDPSFMQDTNYSLADVLRAIYAQGPANKTLITLECDGQLIITSFDNAWKKLDAGPTWNLTTDYDGQTAEVKEFIGKALGV